MTHDDDEIRRELSGWRYLCHRGTRCNIDRTGPYQSEPLPQARAELVQRIHRHRHTQGTAGRFAPHHHEGMTHDNDL